ncbi:O-methyltransferase [Segatella oulorum]|uniref:O-methyltransferase n=1 Tax=Segatella oulorum TaxID=28136 RepID=UPI0023F2D525|nr:O-methyltransferase [Segatella oulorum]
MSDVTNQPFYHLRPNKNIDRSLFLQTLMGLSRQLPISDYQYTGFGSYLFDDFKLMHEELNISKMVSLERDQTEFERAQFNLPYNCIAVQNVDSMEYLSDLSLGDNDHNIFWLDFVSPSELGQQLADYATLLNVLNPNDIVRITLNANPSSLDKLNKSDNPDQLQIIRLQNLKERIPDEYFPPSLIWKDMTRAKYPLALLKILRAITTQLLPDRPLLPNFMLPLFSTIYADGQQMLTFTGIVLDKHKDEELIKKALQRYSHNTFTWDEPWRIEIPSLSVRELAAINKLLPNSNGRQQLLDTFPFIFSCRDPQIVDSYIAYYKYYPNYHQVNF